MNKEGIIASTRIGIDVGGTFTDLVVVSGDQEDGIRRHKTPSTPDDPSEAVEQGLRDLIEQGVDPEAVDAVVHGTTIGLNTIIQRSGARTTLVTSRGHRDVLGIARARLPESFDLHAAADTPLVPRDRVLEIDARLSSTGQLLKRPTDSELDQLATDVLATEPEAVAFSLVQGFTAPDSERELATALQSRLGGIPVVSAARSWPEIREYERTLVAVLEAHIKPLMVSYYSRLRRRLEALGLNASLFISASNGGALTVDYASEHPLETVLSGPASGVTAAAMTQTDRNILTFDMGGTSSDMSVVIDGSPALTTRTMLGGLPLMLPVVDVSAIGSGGGSMISPGQAGDAASLRIGPRSAGAVPGPVSYRRGGTVPTITDAYLSSGVLDPAGFLGGALPLDRDAADAALSEVARRDAGSAAEHVLGIATVQMATSLRTLLAERGYEPGEFTLVPFGGAGPTHALLLAEELGIDRVTVPGAAATFCALGAAVAPLRRDLARSVRRDLDPEVEQLAGQLVTQLHRDGLDWLRSSGADTGDARLRLAADMRYHGQAYELTVALSEQDANATREVMPDLEAVREAFHREHERVHGFRDTTAAIELGTLRLAVLSAAPDSITASAPISGTATPQPASHRPVRFRGAWHETAVHTITELTGKAAVAGPAVIDISDSTVLVPEGWTCAAAPDGTLHLAKENSA